MYHSIFAPFQNKITAPLDEIQFSRVTWKSFKSLALRVVNTFTKIREIREGGSDPIHQAQCGYMASILLKR